MLTERVCVALCALIFIGTLTKISQACPPNCTCRVKKGRGKQWGGGGGRGSGRGGSGGRTGRREVFCTGRSLTNPIPADTVPGDTVLLDLSDNGIKVLREGAFTGLSSVQTLNLSMNSISYIEPRAFAGLENLVVLDLTHNQLGSVNNSMFIGLPSLQELDISYNQISTIAAASFERLTSLSKVNFQSDFLVCDCKLEWIVRWEKTADVRIKDETKCAIPKSLKGQSVHALRRQDLHCNFPLELPRFEIHPSNDQLVFKGDLISLECIATHIDETQRMVWLRNNKILETNATAGISIETRILEDQSLMTSTLTIEQILLDSTGLWKMECRVLTDHRRGDGSKIVDLYVFGSVNQTLKCQETITTDNKGSFHWPTTLPAMTAEVRCPHGGGSQYSSGPNKAVARRFCTDTGLWNSPQTNPCEYAAETTRTLERVAMTTYNNISMARLAARTVEIETTYAHLFSDKLNVIFVGRFIEKIRRFTNEENLGQIMINIASNLMEANASILAESQLQERSCSKIVTALEEFASNVLRHESKIDIDHYAPNIAVRAIRMVATTSFSGMMCAAFVPGPGQLSDFNRQNVKCHMSNITSAQLDVTKGPVETSIQLPPTIFQGLAQGQRSSVSSLSSSRPGIVLQFFVYKNGRLFPSFKTTSQGDVVMSDRVVTSMVVSSKIENYNVLNLTDPVTLTFRPTTQGHSAVPGYWHFGEGDSHGEWKSDGCKIVQETDNMTTVHCTHLTNFAILKDFSDPQEKYVGGFWLSATLHPAMYVGSFLLLILLFITLLTYICFHSNIRMKRKCRHSLINICLSLMLLVVFYAGGINRTEPALGCQIVGIGLHYFTICTLTWMVIQANNLRKALQRRDRPPLPPGEIPPPPRPILRFYFVGWGVPMIVVGITAAASPDIGNYGGTEFCWIVDFKVSLAAFFGIAAAMVLAICAMFAWASLHIHRAPALPPPQIYELRDQTVETKDTAHHGENGVERQVATDNDSVVTHRTGMSALSSVMDAEYTYRKQITAAVLMLLGFVGTWTFGALAVTQEGLLFTVFCYLYGGAAVVLGLFIFIYNCGMRSDVTYNWRKTCGCIRKDQYAVAVASAQANTPINNGHVVQRRQSASSLDSNLTNRSNNTNHSYPSVKSGSRKTTSKCNYVPSHTNTGTDASIDSSTQDNAGRVHMYDKHRSNGYPHRYHKQGRSRSKNHKHSRYSQISREGQEAVSMPQVIPVVPNGAGRTGSSSSFPITHMHHIEHPMHSPASSNSYLHQHAPVHYPRMVPLPQDLHSSHSGLGINSQPEALCTTQSWDALRENSLPRSTASSDRYMRDRIAYAHPVKNNAMDCPHDGSLSRKKASREDLKQRGSSSKNSSRDKLPRHEDIAECPSPETNPLIGRTRVPSTEKPPTYDEVSTLPECQALIGGSQQIEEEPVNGSESDASSVLKSKLHHQTSQSGLNSDKKETSV